MSKLQTHLTFLLQTKTVSNQLVLCDMKSDYFSSGPDGFEINFVGVRLQMENQI